MKTNEKPALGEKVGRKTSGVFLCPQNHTGSSFCDGILNAV